MKLYNKSEFYQEIFSLSYTDLFFPYFFLISLYRNTLLDIQKTDTNLSLTMIFQTVFQTLRGTILCHIWSELQRTTKKVIILDPAGKHMVKVNDRNIRNRRTPRWNPPFHLMKSESFAHSVHKKRLLDPRNYIRLE